MAPRKQRRRPERNGSAQQLRIIGGRWRGRRLSFADAPGLRPTGDRVRETLFNWLGPDLVGARCLDAFAGSGALGLEALSRGADSVVFLENDPRAAASIAAACDTLNAEGARVRRCDALAWLARPDETKPFDVIFLDPPFAAGLLEPACLALEQSGLLAPEALIYVESGREEGVSPPADWHLARDKNAGQVRYSLYRRN